MKWIRWITLLLILVMLAACSQTMSSVRVSTLPSGGRIQVVETGAIVADGQKLQLPAGQYTLVPYATDNSPVEVAIEVDGETPLNVLVPTTPGMTRFTLKTSPPGARVTLVELNRLLHDGESVEVPAGRYTFKAALPGYRPEPVVVETTGSGEEEVFIPLGDGFGSLIVTAVAADASLTIDNKVVGPLPVTRELKAGQYALQVKAPGYRQLSRTIHIAAAQKLSVKLDLEKIPTHAAVAVETRPAGGVLLLDKQKVGTGNVQLENILLGQHRLVATKKIDALTRLAGDTVVTVTAPKTTVVVKMNRRERLFAGCWLAEDEALAKEMQRFKRQQVTNPVALEVNLSRQQVSDIFSVKEVVRDLHAALRVGDALVIKTGNKSHLLVKRNREVTAAWRAAVTALQNGAELDLPWKPTAVVASSQNPATLAGMLLELQRLQNRFPLVDLSQEQLNKGGETIPHTQSDGPLTLLAVGDSGLTIDGQPVKKRSGFYSAAIAAGQSPVKIAWQQPPLQLLVVCAEQIPLNEPRLEKTLLLGEKKLVTLTSAQVVKVERLTRNPVDKTWQRKSFVAQGPLAAQMNLSVDEVGPHDKAGDYERVWLVQLEQQGGVTQRQVMTRYQVTSERKDNQSERFLRRDGLSAR